MPETIASSPKLFSRQLGDLISEIQSGFASGERAQENGIAQLRMNNVTTDGALDWSNYIRVPTTGSQLEKYQLRVGDILFNSTNSPELVGKTTIFDGFQEAVVFSNHFLRLRVKQKEADPYYVAWWLNSQWQKRIFENLATSWVNQASVRREDLLALQINYPPLPEQQRIAAILAKADRLRRLRRYALDLGESYLQSVFLEMFGDFRQFQRSEFGELMLGTPKNGLYLQAEKYGEGVPIIRINNFYRGVLNNSEGFKRVQANEKQIKEFEVINGEILINRVNSIEYLGKCALVEGIKAKTLFESNMMRIRPNTELLHPVFLVNYLSSQEAYMQILQCAKHAVNQASVNQEDVKSLKIPRPPMPLQIKFAKIKLKYQRLLAQQREAARQAEHLFQTLLHRAFVGEL